MGAATGIQLLAAAGNPAGYCLLPDAHRVHGDD